MVFFFRVERFKVYFVFLFGGFYIFIEVVRKFGFVLGVRGIRIVVIIRWFFEILGERVWDM